MLETKYHYAVHMVFPFIASFTDKILGFGGGSELIRMNCQETDIVNKEIADQKNEAWQNGELGMLRSEIGNFKSVVESVSASHCAFVLCALELHRLDHLREDLERFESFYFTDTRSLGNSTCSLGSRIEQLLDGCRHDCKRQCRV